MAKVGTLGDGKIHVFNTHTGAPCGHYDIPAHRPTPDHGLVGVALDESGHLYVADIQLHGIVQLDLETGETENYVNASRPSSVCAAAYNALLTATARPPFPNDMAFDEVGNLYVTYSFQATIWKVPPGGGTAVPWYQSADFYRVPFGPNGIRFSPGDKELCVAVYGDPGGSTAYNRPSETPSDTRQLPG
jgi:sugar lactone lactonase YvrE